MGRHVRITERLPRRNRRVVALAAAVALGGAILIPSNVTETLAGWTGSETAAGTLTAYQYQPVSGPIGCKHEFILLNGNKATLTWPALPNMPTAPLKSGYHLTVESPDGTGTMTVASNTAVFQNGLLDGLLGLLFKTNGPVKISVRSALIEGSGTLTDKYRTVWASLDPNPPTLNLTFAAGVIGLGGFTCPT